MDIVCSDVDEAYQNPPGRGAVNGFGEQNERIVPGERSNPFNPLQ